MTNTSTNQGYSFGPFRLDPIKRCLYREGELVALTPKAFEILLVLVENHGQIVEREELMKRVWPDSLVEESNLSVNIFALRKALGDSLREHQYIVTVPGRGYSFVAGVREWKPTVEQNEEKPVGVMPASEIAEAPQAQGGAAKSYNLETSLAASGAAPAITQSGTQSGPQLLRPALAVVALVAIAALLWGGYQLVKRSRPHIRFSEMQVIRLTNTGKAREAAISPNGQYVAYVVDDVNRQSLWVKHLATNAEVQVIPPAEGRYRGITFSHDSNYLYYVRSEGEFTTRSLYQMPVIGGAARKLLSGVDSPITLSPDGTRLAFVREHPGEISFLVVANADGSGERLLGSRKLPASSYSVEGPAWSPDGQFIACPVARFTGSLNFYLALVNVQTGQETPLGAQDWLWMRRVAWIADGSGLILPAQPRPMGTNLQLWFVSYPDGQVYRITNDLNDYRGLSLTTDARMLVTVKSEKQSNIWLLHKGDFSLAKQITFVPSRQDGYDGLDWTPEGKIVYTSTTSGQQDLWIMEANGDQPRRLTYHPYDNAHYPSVSGDGRYVIFVSMRSGAPRIWRVNIDGTNALELTKGDFDNHPDVSSDGQWVAYTSINSGLRTLWRMQIDGSQPTPLCDKLVEFPAISPDGTQIACGYEAGQKSQTRMAVIPATGGPPLYYFDTPVTQSTLLQWHPDGKSLTYIETRDGVSNIWRQPLAGGPPKQLTSFKSEQIFHYAWSRDGHHLACARGVVNRDVVLIKGFR